MDIGCLGKEFHFPQVDDEMDDVGLEVEISPDIRTVVRVPREVMSLNPSVAFESSGDRCSSASTRSKGGEGQLSGQV
jgi:hypothetical protein